jgi:spore maturation protein CgeB
MKILIIGEDVSLDLSYNYINIAIPLTELGHELDFFDVTKNKLANTNKISKILKVFKPSLIFFIPVKDELDLNFVKELSNIYTTLAYMYDDTWRIKYSYKWVNSINYIVTTNPNWRISYKDFQHKIIFSPFFINTNNYINNRITIKKYEISFVGQYHPYRHWIIKKIQKAGFNVNVFGDGWTKNSTVSFNEMVDIFNTTKINLNLSNCINYDIRYILDIKTNSFVSLLKSIKLIISSYYKNDMKIYEMVKARFFEINSCGGFQIGFYAQGLENVYDIGNEIVLFSNVDELINKIKYYLEFNSERNIISENGYKRTIINHNSKRRLEYILSKILF